MFQALWLDDKGTQGWAVGKADIARNPFTAAYTKISKFGGAQAAMGHHWRAAGRGDFFRGQGERLAPGRYRFHLPVGQPLASDCRSTPDWDPYLGIMRLGVSWVPGRTSPPRGE